MAHRIKAGTPYIDSLRQVVYERAIDAKNEATEAEIKARTLREVSQQIERVCPRCGYYNSWDDLTRHLKDIRAGSDMDAIQLHEGLEVNHDDV